jgi:hypothetical protein
MLAVCIVAICAGLEVYALVDRSAAELRNRDIRRYVLGEISRDVFVAQQFRVRADGLSSITIYSRRTSDTPAGTAIAVLRDMKSGIVDRVEMPLSTLAEAQRLTLRFRPQPSRERDYRLEFMVVDAPRGHGIGLLATRGEGHRRAVLSINRGRPRWGDLVFETTVDGASSNFRSIASQLARAGVPAAGAVLALLLLAKSAALLLLIYAFAIQRTSATAFDEVRAGVA